MILFFSLSFFFPFTLFVRFFEEEEEPESLKSQIKKQVGYYFSAENLERDQFLRSKMDQDYFVPLDVIAQVFPLFRQSAN